MKAAELLVRALLVGTLAITAVTASAQQACTSPEALVRLDHAVVVVRDLDAAAARFAPLGFVFKQGRLHPDSLLNRHIKFRDGTEIELMTVVGTPTSRMARDYQQLVNAGGGCVYAALWTDDIERVRQIAERLGAPRLTRLGPWSFLSLPGVSDTHGVFFGAGGASANDPDSVLSHPNDAQSLSSAWVEAGPALDNLLKALGSQACDSLRLPDGRTGTRWALARGSLVVVHDTGRRVVGVEVERYDKAPRSVHQPLPGFWVRLEGPDR